MPETQPTVLVLTALPLEYAAVRAQLEQWQELVHPDGTRVERGRLPGTPWHVAIGELGVGEGRAASLTTGLVNWLNPEAVFFVGIAASVKDDVGIGDVVVSTRVYEVHGGRTPEGFPVRPKPLGGSRALEQSVRSAVRDMPDVRAHFRPIATGDAALADPESEISRFIRRNHNDVVAIDMEGSGPAHAADLNGPLDVVVIRGISDHADAAHKSAAPGAQERAAERAASLMVAALRRHRPKAEGVSGRRYAILVGVSRYSSGLPDLPGAVDDVQRLDDVLGPMGYERVLSEVSLNPTSAELRAGLDRWSREQRLGPDDVLVAYFAGHGVRHGGRQYLLCSDDDDRFFRHSAITLDDFTTLVTDDLAGHSLILLNACWSGASTARDTTASAFLPGSTRPSEGNAWVLSSARDGERAESSTFTRALQEVLTGPPVDRRQRFLSIRSVAEGVRERLRASDLFQAFGTTTYGEEDPFFPNPAYVPGLPPDELDISSVVRLRREQDDHFTPPGRGVAHASVEGDFFVGRLAALNALTDWLDAPGGDNETLVVTGAAGSGKSALLGRLILLMDPDSAARLSLPPTVSTPPDAALIALSCRTTTPADITARLAAALALPAASDRHDVFAALGARTDPLVIILDGLDEAPDGDRLVAELIRPLSPLPGVRLVIGARPHEVARLGPAVRVIDLDEPPYRDDADLEQYAYRMLLGEATVPHARRSLLYAADPARARTDAAAIARRAQGSFLVAQLAVHAMVDGGGTAERSPGSVPTIEELYESYAGRGSHGDARRAPSAHLLLPLAYAQGAGLPPELWAPVAEALSDEPCTDEDVRDLVAQRHGLIVEDRQHGATVYRFFHQTFAEYLRPAGQDRERHRRVALALIRQVPLTASGERDWGAANPYIREHLVTHAVAGRVLDGLLPDVGFLRHAAQGPLLRALRDNGTTGSAPSSHVPTPTGDDGSAEGIASRLLSERPIVLVVATEWFSSHGGLSTFNRYLCTALAAAGAQVFCTVLEANATASADAESKGVTLLCHPGAPGAPEYGRLSRRPRLDVEPDLIIGHGRITGPAAVHLNEDCFPKARRLHIIHMAPDEIEWHKLDATTDRAQLAEDRTEIERELAATAHRTFAIGPRLHGRFSNALCEADVLPPLQLDPGFDLQPGVLPAPRTPPPGFPLKVLLAGRTDDARLKGVDLAARALGLVHELRTKASTDPVELLVRGALLGEGEAQRNEIIGWSGVHALEVTVRGFSPDPGRLDQDMGCASLVIMPSRSEGFGLIGVEAIIRGVPLLVSGNSGLAQLLRKELGGDAEELIVPVTMDIEADAVVWAERINRCLDNRESAYARIADVRSRLSARVTWAAAAALVLGEAPPRREQVPGPTLP
ncbi:phosphorylase family protein [Streptomyces sp. NBC_01244]|uniref:phosphorylase family protein n=1 Tax=Streptomyces sp. NBC_01244 TaxID=2903797 RepID=UPI002E13BF1F|nr:caspase family protein [Streptomyces sp. NBC_01244]